MATTPRGSGSSSKWAADLGNSDTSKHEGLDIMAALIQAGALVTPTCISLALDCSVEKAHKPPHSADRPYLLRLLELLQKGGARWDGPAGQYGKKQTCAECLFTYFPEGLEAIGLSPPQEPPGA